MCTPTDAARDTDPLQVATPFVVVTALHTETTWPLFVLMVNVMVWPGVGSGDVPLVSVALRWRIFTVAAPATTLLEVELAVTVVTV